MIHDLIRRIFFKPNWKLAIREFNKEDLPTLCCGIKVQYNSIKTSGNYWCADPFICIEEDKIYVFCECYLNDKNKGVIAAGEYSNGRLNGMRIIIEQDYHMSYPCIFKYNSDFYMIPETADNRTIELYKAKCFPYDWKLVKVLRKNIKCVDTTVVIDNDKLYAVGYILSRKKNKVCIFNLDIVNMKLETIDEVDGFNTDRPAGDIIHIDKKVIRPTQISVKKYGEGIGFKEIVSSEGKYEEKLISKIQGKDISIDFEKSIDRIHTINRTNNLEIIDYSHDTFELVRPIHILTSRLKSLLTE